jgi:hypothetical protein
VRGGVGAQGAEDATEAEGDEACELNQSAPAISHHIVSRTIRRVI